MRVMVAGGSGSIGSALGESLARDGHDVVVLSRRPEQARVPSGARAAAWDGRSLGAWVEELAAADALVQLAGEPVLGRWTAAKKRRLRESRVASSRLLAEAFASVPRRPPVLLQGSAVGYYGDRGDQPVTEGTASGEEFLAQVARDWEQASAGVEALGVRRPVLRTGVVLSRRGGALPLLRLASLAFVGGPLGRGDQWTPWIHESDVVGAIRFLIDHPAATGPFNLTAPEPVTNRELSRAVGRALGRPSWLPAPRWGLRLVFGELGDHLLEGQRARPERLLALGYRFRFPELTAALDDLLRR